MPHCRPNCGYGHAVSYGYTRIAMTLRMKNKTLFLPLNN